jgi:hypothetical protein
MRLLVREETTHLEAETLKENKSRRHFFVVVAKTTLEMGILIETP